MNDDGRLISVFGRTGSGKSTLTKSLIKLGREKLIVFDTVGEYGGRGWVQCATRSDVIAAMKARWKRGFKISFAPRVGHYIEDLHSLSRIAMSVQQPFKSGGDHRPLTLVIEEADVSMPARAVKAEFSGMQGVTLQGRHFGVHAVVISQRPSLVSMNYRGNVSTSYVFALGNHNDREEIAKVIGRQHLPMLTAMQNHEFIRIQDGSFQKGTTNKNGSLSYVRTGGK